MKFPTLFSPGAVEAAPAATDSLEQILGDLCRYGSPRISKHDSGWHCSVDVFVTAVGVKFECKTGFDQPTAHAAALSCRDRLHAALKGLTA